MNYSILIAEDDFDDRLLIQDAFEANGIEAGVTEYAENGDELMTILSNREEPPTLIFMDLNMPKMDGREAIKAIKSDPQFKQIPVIVFTTSASEDDIQSSYLQGVNTYFTKPTMFKDLVEMVSVIKTYWLEKAALTPLNFYIR
ncbi:response regulator [Marinoscillum pacificum]|uniref:response regulator n=1 Tax=Marinoscillum pacificum TaxID=392723 RepID=UPI002157852A|nr:response regulator [Marinoscillum pacificum]